MPENSDVKQDEHHWIRKLINTGAEIAGSAVGGALGFLAGGPVGAAVLISNWTNWGSGHGKRQI